MATAQIFFDSNNERAIITQPGKPDARRHLRDEMAAARFAHEMGYSLASRWEMLPLGAPSELWERACLRESA